VGAFTSLTASFADRYRIERELGAGGMATVYLAHDIKHDRKVAINDRSTSSGLAVIVNWPRMLETVAPRKAQ
jgi:hypothetical protein